MRTLHRLLIAAVLGGMFGTGALHAGQEASEAQYPRAPQAAILSMTGTRYPGITRALENAGFHVGEVSAKAYGSLPRDPHRLLIVPENEGRQVPPELVATILRDVEAGMPLLLDGPTTLAGRLGVHSTGTREEMKTYDWEHYAPESIELPSRVAYTRVTVNPPLEELAHDYKHKAPQVISGSRGQGRFLYSAIPLEPAEGLVFEYLPFVAQAVVDELHLTPALAADNLCIYMDAGTAPQGDPAAYVTQLKSWSVREVHLGAFYGSEGFRQFAPRFIAAAHREGIAVYAWLEYPMVSQEFWDLYPQWREVTANGQPAIMDWRNHMALENPECFQAVADLTRRLLRDYDWDGVDFAELYFEGMMPIFKHPRDFTPMSPVFRQMFQHRYGVDPRRMFDRFSSSYGPRHPQLAKELEGFRVDLITQLTEKFLQILADCQKEKPYLQTTLTFIDALRDPTVTERFGVDPARLLALQREFGFSVEIEDPYTVWNSTPDRYRAIGEHYRPQLQPGTPFSLDVNVVDRIPRGRPLNRPRGLELYELLANVAASVDLVTLYAYNTLSIDDMRLVPFVLGRQQLAGGSDGDGRVQLRRQLIWHTDTRGRSVYMDGHEWPCRSDSQVIIPAGEHTVFTRPDEAGIGATLLNVEGMNGTLLGAKRSGARIILTYEARGRCYILLNRPPAVVLCDGAPNAGTILSNGKRACVLLPQGHHTVEMQ